MFTDKYTSLVIVFGVYVIAIPLFALAYFRLYRRNSANFVFASEIYMSRLTEKRIETSEKIMGLRILIKYFADCSAHLLDKTVRIQRSIDKTTIHFNNNQIIILERFVQHVPQGGESELAPFVRLYRPDGAQEWQGLVVGHGFLSDFNDPVEYIGSVVQPLKDDLDKVESYLKSLDQPKPVIWGYLDFLYFSTITQSTVGYGDILPNSSTVRSVVIVQLIITYALLIIVLNVVLTKLSS